MQYTADFIKDILARHGKVLKKSLGQNFLYDKRILDAIVGAAVEDSAEYIVEIGAGVGLLTDLLCQNAKIVVTVEIDDTLPALLEETVVHDNFILHLEDVLRADPHELTARYFGGAPFTVVGNLPYYITTKILRLFTLHRSLLQRAVIMVQKEVADRLQCATGTKEYRAVTVIMQALFAIRSVCTVPPHCFVPAPHVDSAVLTLIPRENCGITTEEIPAFSAFVNAAFAARRKQLKSVASALSSTPSEVEQALVRLGFPPTSRAEVLSPADFVKFFHLLQNNQTI